MIFIFTFHSLQNKKEVFCVFFFTPSSTLASNSYYVFNIIRRKSNLHVLTRMTVVHMVNQMIDFWALRFIHQKQFFYCIYCFYVFSEILKGSYYVRCKGGPTFGSLFSVIHVSKLFAVHCYTSFF